MQNRAGLWVLTATHAANDFYAGAVSALLPFLILERHYDYAVVAGITLAATSLSSVAQPAFGLLADRFRMRWLVLAGLLTAGVGIAVSGLFADSYAATWIAIAISGIGVAAYHPSGTVLAREYGGGTNRSLSIFSVGGNVGAALAPTGVLLTVGVWGLSATPLLMIPAAVMGAAFLLRPRGAEPAAKTASADAHAPVAQDDWRGFGVLVAVLACWSVAYIGTSSFITLYGIQRFGISTAEASIALTVFPAAGAAGTLIGGFLADRFGRLRVVRAGYALAVLAMVGIVLAPSAPVAVIATAVLGIALFLPFSPQVTLSHAFLPNRIGLASGVTLGLTLSFGGLMGPALGAIADASSVRVSFVVMLVLLVIALMVALVLRDPARREVERVLAA
ncbi:FSR family fosmidomycin resistance protein-like MFS transporter [Mycetocola sp. BIGb0189]|uniref:MFS transporter n=1 Tax=Mycetocola sp. BIGb0189 TaxID=2940604 RepID=UPI00216A43E0|nr:MFS transporter [Mycetocola sp. BIGb0189]MCS4275748.1 FSR family fosmidomycin resistance protein-like MFS transporter [Mycetocola sp. BIGb0189]